MADAGEDVLSLKVQIAVNRYQVTPEISLAQAVDYMDYVTPA